VELRRKGNHQQGEGMATRGGNSNNNINAQQLHKYKNHNICLFNCNSCRALEAARGHANPSNINLIFMDVMC
jgi:hypothetical protein